MGHPKIEDDFGLYFIEMETVDDALGAPKLLLSLTVDTVNDTVQGTQTITQAVNKPIVSSGVVHGVVIDEYTMDSGAIRYDLVGYPRINWNPNNGIGPVIPQNFKAMIVLEVGKPEGKAFYKYTTDSCHWNRVAQEIRIIS